ncbi:esf1 [Scenedesmus sp. PABB004]|nr:esf1 [Scenedesmus sp. PABB004]
MEQGEELRRLKEAFVSGHAGTTKWEVFCVVGCLPLLLLVAAYAEAWLAARARSSRWRAARALAALPQLAHEYALVVAPCVLLLLSVAPAEPAFLLLFLLWGSLALKAWMRLAHSPASRSHMLHMLAHLSAPRKRYVSVFRGGVSLLTCAAILGVDFAAFPRRYAKAEAYGAGLMDRGCGGATRRAGRRAAGAARWARRVARGVRAAAPLVALGGARLVVVGALGYQAPLGEYGLHWNFFFTIAAVSLASLAAPLPPRWLGPAGLAVAALHQAALSLDLGLTPAGRLAAWVAAPLPAEARRRLGWGASNKEGLASLPGYWALHLLGGAAGHHLAASWTAASAAARACLGAGFKPGGAAGTGGSGRAAAAVAECARVVWSWVGCLLLADGAVWGALLAAEAWAEPISRRSCNLAYVLWVCAQCLAWLLLCLIADLLTCGLGAPASSMPSPLLSSRLARISDGAGPAGPPQAPGGGGVAALTGAAPGTAGGARAAARRAAAQRLVADRRAGGRRGRQRSCGRLARQQRAGQSGARGAGRQQLRRPARSAGLAQQRQRRAGGRRLAGAAPAQRGAARRAGARRRRERGGRGGSGGAMRLAVAFNRNMLPLFLLANLLTGAVNLSLNTLAVGRWPARAIVGLYMLVLCCAAVALDNAGVTLKPCRREQRPVPPPPCFAVRRRPVTGRERLVETAMVKGKKKAPPDGGGPPAAAVDPRFARMHTDPRFQRFPKKKGAVEIDARFASMFSDPEFAVRSAVVDKRGRRLDEGGRTRKADEAMKRYYRLKDEQEEPQGGDGEQQPTAAAAAAEPAGKARRQERPPAAQPQAKAKRRGAAAAPAAAASSEEAEPSGSEQEEEPSDSPSGDASSSDGEQPASSDGGAAADAEEEEAQRRWMRARGLIDVSSSSEEEEEGGGSEQEEEPRRGKGSRGLAAALSSDDEVGDSGLLSSDWEEDGAGASSDGDSGGMAAALQEWGVGALAANPDEVIPVSEETSRLAVVDLDWANITAADVLAVMRSFDPHGGTGVLRVVVHPSDYGLERMAEEAAAGPQGKQAAPAPPRGAAGGGDGGGGEEEEEGAGLDPERVRLYERSKLRWYYAVVECDSAATAARLYEACDGVEYERSACKLDLRFIPEDLDLTARPVRDTASEVPPGYAPPDLFSGALQHTEPKLSWDETDKRRKKVLSRKVGEEELAEGDFAAYLASSSGDEEEGGSEEEGGEGSQQTSASEEGDAQAAEQAAQEAREARDAQARRRRSKKGAKAKEAVAGGDDAEALRARYRSLLLGDAAVERAGGKSWGAAGGGDGGDGSDGGEARAQRRPPRAAAGAGRGLGSALMERKREAAAAAHDSVWEAYLRRRAEKRRARKAAGRRDGSSSSDGDDDDGGAAARARRARGGGAKAAPGGAAAPPPLPSAAGMRRAKPKRAARRRRAGGGSKEERAAAARQAAELELLLMDDDALRGAARGVAPLGGAAAPDGDGDGDGARRGQKLSRKERARQLAERKRARRGAAGGGSDDEAAAKAGGGGFAVDLDDPRFAGLLGDAAFALDPTDPRYAKTQGVDALAAALARKRAALGAGGAPAAAPAAPPAADGAPDGAGPRAELKGLVAKLKRKHAAAAADAPVRSGALQAGAGGGGKKKRRKA